MPVFPSIRCSSSLGLTSWFHLCSSVPGNKRKQSRRQQSHGSSSPAQLFNGSRTFPPDISSPRLTKRSVTSTFGQQWRASNQPTQHLLIITMHINSTKDTSYLSFHIIFEVLHKCSAVSCYINYHRANHTLISSPINIHEDISF